MKARSRSLFLAMGLAVLAACACAAAWTVSATAAVHGKTTASPTFNVLVVTELSGPYAAFGGAYEPGLFAASHLINGWGGILGHKIALDFVDDQSSPVTAVTALQNALSGSRQYNMVVTDLSVFTSSLAPLIAKAGILNPTSATADSLLKNTPYPTLFSFSANTYAPMRSLADVLKRKGVANVGIVTPPTPSATGSASILTGYLQGEGIAASSVVVPTTTVDATPQLQQLQAKGAQAVVLLGFSPVVNSVLAARAKLGWGAPVYCDNACSAVNWTQIPSDQRNGVLAQELGLGVQGSAATQTKSYALFAKTIAKYDKTYSLGIIVDIEGWNIMMAVRAAAKKAQSIASPKLISALSSMSSSLAVPWYVGPKGLFASGTVGDNDWAHAVHATAADYLWVPATPLVDGLMPSGK